MTNQNKRKRIKVHLPDISDIQPLPSGFGKNDLWYELHQDDGYKAIYRTENGAGRPVSYEIFYVELAPPTTFIDNGLKREYPWRKKVPSNEDFGKTAWAYSNLETALKWYENMSAGRLQAINRKNLLAKLYPDAYL